MVVCGELESVESVQLWTDVLHYLHASGYHVIELVYDVFVTLY